MKLCMVMPYLFYLKVNDLILNEYPTIMPYYMIYDDYKETPDLLRDKQKKYDAVLFFGQSPYEYCLQFLRQEIFWDYVPSAGTTLLRALLEATLRGWDINRLSIDTYSHDLLVETFSEFGADKSKLDIKIFKGNRTDADYVTKATAFHKRNLRYGSGRGCGCVTALIKVAEALEKDGLPYIIAQPTYNILREKLYEALRIYRAKRNAKGLIAVMVVKIDYPTDYPTSIVKG